MEVVEGPVTEIRDVTNGDELYFFDRCWRPQNHCYGGICIHEGSSNTFAEIR